MICYPYVIFSFKQKEMRKIRLTKNTWYDWLVKYIPETVRKIIGGIKDKVIILLRQIHLNKQV